MQVTSVRVRKTGNGESKLKAYCSVVFNDAFVLHHVRVVEGINGVFVAMPRRRTAEGEYRDLAHPITAEAREQIHKAVLEAFYDTEDEESATA